jgi:hypothetical protein
MQMTDAVELINMIPRHGYCEMRGGYESFCTGIGSGDVDFVKEFYDGSTRKLLAASSTNVYDITGGTASSLVGSMTNGRWDATMHNGTMIFVNGADAPQTYDGTTWSAATISGPTTVADLIGCHTHKNRGYYWLKQDQSFWYAAANTLAGALTEFSLGQIAKKGGRLLTMETWTVDGGAGPDDYAVFVMDSGEVIVYAGSDPGSASAWSLVGIYDVGEMFDDRMFVKYGGQLLAVAAGDLITMPQAFSTPAMPATKISDAMSQAVSNFGSNDGWQLFIIPNEHLLIINVPVATVPDLFDQYVQNLETGAFCRFTNIPARVWAMYNGDAYFGGVADGKVYKFNSLQADNSTDDINVTIKNAWTDLGMAENKMVTTVRPVFSSLGDIPMGIDVAYDFKEPSISSPSSTSSGGTPWGSPWGSSWGSQPGIIGTWRTVAGRGSATSLQMRFSRQGDRPKLYKTDALVRPEGNLW